MRHGGRAAWVVTAMVVAGIWVAAARDGAPARPVDPERDRVLRLLSGTPLIDGHNDLAWAIRKAGASGRLEAYGPGRRAPGHTDLDRLREGRVGAQLWSVYVPCELAPFDATWMQREQIALALRFIETFPEHLALALTADDVERVFRSGRIASLLAIEGGHVIASSLDSLRAFYDLGVRAMTLTHNCSLAWADAATGGVRAGGLSDSGRAVVREMNRLGMLIDLSHVSAATMHHVLDVSRAPVIFSHSSARALTNHPRNVPDDVLRRLPDNGGIVMVTFVPEFVAGGAAAAGGPPSPRPSIDDVVAHIEHVRKVAGPDHVGIGGDFDGVSRTTAGLEDVSRYPDLFVALARRGWSDADLRKLAGLNLLRVMRAVEAVRDSMAS
ncbi:MAG TPA: dipeptidase [Longimicrobiales bacterium]|nr:dipeptidase [Longimicrobiales bacterium]